MDSARPPSSNAQRLARKRRDRIERKRIKLFALAKREARLRLELSRSPASFKEEAERQGSDLLYAYYALGKTNFRPVLAEMREHLSQMARELGFEVTDPDDFQILRGGYGEYEVIDHGEHFEFDAQKWGEEARKKLVEGYYSWEEFEAFGPEEQAKLLAEIYAEKDGPAQ